MDSVCPLCQKSEGQLLCCLNDLATNTILQAHTNVNGQMHVAFFRSCSQCDFCYFYPLPNDEFFVKFYANEANTHQRNMQALLAAHPENKKKWEPTRWDTVLSFLESHDIDFEKIRQGRSVDVGCGEGDFIQYMNKRGYHFEGIDPTKVNCDFISQRYQAKTFCGMIKDVPEAEHGQFSLVTSFASLEHHKAPIETLNKFYKLLHENGVLFIEVPNLNARSFQAAPLLHPYYAFPAHVNYFSANAIRAALSRIGFVDINITTITNPEQMLWCWEPAAKLGYINSDHTLLDELSKNDQHENLFVFAVKGSQRA